MDRFIDSLMAEMTLEEKVGQTNLLTWDGSLQTGAAKSTGVSEKIARGVVGGLFNVGSLKERIGSADICAAKFTVGDSPAFRTGCDSRPSDDISDTARTGLLLGYGIGGTHGPDSGRGGFLGGY